MLHLRTRASLDTGRRIVAASLGALLLALVGTSGAQAREARGESLNRTSSVQAVTPNGRVTQMSHSTVNPGTGKGTSLDVTRAIGARTLWEQGYWQWSRCCSH